MHQSIYLTCSSRNQVPDCQSCTHPWPARVCRLCKNDHDVYFNYMYYCRLLSIISLCIIIWTILMLPYSLNNFRYILYVILMSAMIFKVKRQCLCVLSPTLLIIRQLCLNFISSKCCYTTAKVFLCLKSYMYQTLVKLLKNARFTYQWQLATLYYEFNETWAGLHGHQMH